MAEKINKSPSVKSGFISIRGAREHNLKNIDLDIPRDSMVVFTGVSGSGKSSLAFGTLFAEAQRRYLESVGPYARRLFDQLSAPEVGSIEGLPPAIALQQQRGSPSTRSSVGSVTTLSNLLRMLYSRAGRYPKNQPMLYAEHFSTNTPEGACPECHGIGRLFTVTEKTMVPDDTLTIRERAVAAWPVAWQGQNQRDILVSLGIDIDIPWKDLPKKTRDWILYTEETPSVPVFIGFTPAETRRAVKRKDSPSYMGNFTGVKRYVMTTFASTQSAIVKKRVSQHLINAPCPLCHGKKLRKEALSVKFAGLDIAELSSLPMDETAACLREELQQISSQYEGSPEKIIVARRIIEDVLARIGVILDLGLGYLSLERTTPTLSPGELQRLRLATQVRSNLFGVVYVLDEPSAGLHPADTEALLRSFYNLKNAGNSMFIVEHDLAIIAAADWLVDVGPGAGEGGGEVLYCGPPAGLSDIAASVTKNYLQKRESFKNRTTRTPTGWLELKSITLNNLIDLDASFPLGAMSAVTGISGSGKSTLVSHALLQLVSRHLGHELEISEGESAENLEVSKVELENGKIGQGLGAIKRLVQVDQKSIGRTPRSNLATYTGLFDQVRKVFAKTPAAKKRHYDAGRFSFNVAKGRCERCEGEGSVFVELLFLPGVYSPCPVCNGARYNSQTLEITLNGKSIADVLHFTVDEAFTFFKEDPILHRSLKTLQDIGLGYLRLGQPATELSGGEAQRIKLATELQRSQTGHTLYVLDEPTTGLHPSDVDRFLIQLNALVDSGNTVVLIEHEMRVVAQCDWVIDMGPGAGRDGGKITASGTPNSIVKTGKGKTAQYLKEYLE